MSILYASISSKRQLTNSFNFANLNQSIKSACQLAVKYPKALYLLMQRHTHLDSYAGGLVARLASSIGLSPHLFNSSLSSVVDEADRELEIAAKVLAVTIDEH